MSAREVLRTVPAHSRSDIEAIIDRFFPSSVWRRMRASRAGVREALGGGSQGSQKQWWGKASCRWRPQEAGLLLPEEGFPEERG